MLIASDVVSYLGTSITTTALCFLLYYKTGSLAGVSGIFLISSIINIAGAPLFGGILDRYDNKDITIWASLVNGCIVLGLVFAPSIPIVYGLCIVRSTLNLLASNSRIVLLPKIVEEKELESANHLISSLTAATRVIGPAVAGLLFSVWGAKVFLVDAVSFFLSAIILGFVGHAGQYFGGTARHLGSKSRNIVALYREVEREFRKVRWVTAIYCMSIFAITLVNISLTFFVTKYLQSRAEFVGFLDACIGLGMIGNYFVFRMTRDLFQERSELEKFALGKILVGAGVLLCGLVLRKEVALVCFCLIGVGIAFTTSTSRLCFQSRVAKESLGKVLSLHNSLVTTSSVTAVVCSWAIFELIELRHVFVGSGISIVGASVLFFSILRRNADIRYVGERIR